MKNTREQKHVSPWLKQGTKKIQDFYYILHHKAENMLWFDQHYRTLFWLGRH